MAPGKRSSKKVGNLVDKAFPWRYSYICSYDKSGTSVKIFGSGREVGKVEEEQLAEIQPAWERQDSSWSAESIWPKVLQIIRDSVDTTKYSTWFEQLTPLPSPVQALCIAAPNKFVRNWIMEHYHALLLDILRQLMGVPCQVSVIVQEATEPAPPPLPQPAVHLEVRPPAHNGHAASFNLRFTFETLVVGSNNEFAHAACLAVSRHPARTYNPLFIYGDVGLGKTHLLYAIGHYVQRLHPHLVACYVSSEKFLNDLVVALSHDKMDDFRNRYRRNDIILVDDVQFLIGKERTQEEFFHTFNVLYNDSKQIVLTSDKQPKDMTGLEKRLRSRFEWGLVADLQPPDLETKIAILQKKASYRQIPLPDEVVWYIARRIRGDVRKLEGALNLIEAFTSMSGQAPNVDLVRNLIGELAESEEKPITIADIERVVADHYQLKSGLLRSKKRSKDIAHARHVAMYLARTLTSASLPHIGKLFGDRDHTSVLHACNKIKGMINEDWRLQEEIERLIRTLQN
jgi:chromosomal replication initiator protein